MDLEHPLVVHPNTTHEEDVHTNSGTYFKLRTYTPTVEPTPNSSRGRTHQQRNLLKTSRGCTQQCGTYLNTDT